MIPALLSIFSSGGFGAIVGTVGSWLTRKEERKSKEQDHDFQIAMAKINLEESKLDREHELAIADKERIQAQTEGQIATDLKDSEAFVQSQIAGFKPTSIKIVDGIRSLMRPVITVYLLIIATILGLEVSSLTGLDSLDPAMLYELYSGIIEKVLFLTTTAVTWWFGTRNTNKK